MLRHMQWIQITCLGQSSSLVADLYIDMSIFCFSFPRGNHFHDMGRFSNLLVVCLFLTFSQMCFLLMFDLRQKLGVTIQHLIGSDMEPLLLGCGDNTNVQPQVTKPFSKAKIAFSYATCHILAQ